MAAKQYKQYGEVPCSVVDEVIGLNAACNEAVRFSWSLALALRIASLLSIRTLNEVACQDLSAPDRRGFRHSPLNR